MRSLSRPSSHPAQQRHEGDGPQGLPLEALFLLREAHELLLPLRTDGHDEPPAQFQLLNPGLGNR